eukprot:TRINITY_DN441_c0_g3_i2.p1 TRINITY_DN441_c0_g3~~TRINITY_DN441_c0_g3_i2.p1  ORF type:complete len:146 (-),score=7.16 TRINITY_DN441_c0_g3_i2:356-793(-)
MPKPLWYCYLTAEKMVPFLKGVFLDSDSILEKEFSDDRFSFFASFLKDWTSEPTVNFLSSSPFNGASDHLPPSSRTLNGYRPFVPSRKLSILFGKALTGTLKRRRKLTVCILKLRLNFKFQYKDSRWMKCWSNSFLSGWNMSLLY